MKEIKNHNTLLMKEIKNHNTLLMKENKKKHAIRKKKSIIIIYTVYTVLYISLFFFDE